MIIVIFVVIGVIETKDESRNDGKEEELGKTGALGARVNCRPSHPIHVLGRRHVPNGVAS